MASQRMIRTDFDPNNPDSGAIYHNKVEVADAQTSDEYILPIQRVNSITVNLDGNGVIAFTNDPPSIIEAGTADYADWNGTDIINIGVTGFKVTSTSGAVTAKVTVKTDNG